MKFALRAAGGKRNFTFKKIPPEKKAFFFSGGIVLFWDGQGSLYSKFRNSKPILPYDASAYHGVLCMTETYNSSLIASNRMPIMTTAINK